MPPNNALAALDADDTEAASHWARYLTDWTAWNHARAAAALLASALQIAAIHVG